MLGSGVMCHIGASLLHLLDTMVPNSVGVVINLVRLRRLTQCKRNRNAIQGQGKGKGCNASHEETVLGRRYCQR